MIKYFLLVSFLIILFVSNPDFSFHKVKISEEIVTNIEDNALEGLSKMVASFSIDIFNALVYNNLYFVSVTTFKLGENSKVLSFGILGNVFVLKDQIKNNVSVFAYDLKRNAKEKNIKALKKIEKIVKDKKKKDNELLYDLKKQIKERKFKKNRNVDRLYKLNEDNNK